MTARIVAQDNRIWEKAMFCLDDAVDFSNWFTFLLTLSAILYYVLLYMPD